MFASLQNYSNNDNKSASIEHTIIDLRDMVNKNEASHQEKLDPFT